MPFGLSCPGRRSYFWVTFTETDAKMVCSCRRSIGIWWRTDAVIYDEILAALARLEAEQERTYSAITTLRAELNDGIGGRAAESVRRRNENTDAQIGNLNEMVITLHRALRHLRERVERLEDNRPA